MSRSLIKMSLLVTWLALIGGCEARNQLAEPPPPKVTVATPILRPVQQYFETTGQTRAVQSVELRARVGGYLKEINFKDGELVEAGDKLFVIDQSMYAAEVASQQANVKRADAQKRLAEQELKRTSFLAKEDAATASSLDTQIAERDSKAADVEAAKAALEEAKLNLDYTVITAPFAGRMGRHLVDIGNLIISGETMLATLESVDPMHAYFTVSEVDLLHFMELQKEGKIKPITEADPLSLDLSLGDTNDFRFHGRLDFRKFGINPDTGTTERRAVFPNDPAELLPGLFVRIRAAVGEPHEQLLVDERAIGRDQRGDYLLIVNDKNIVETRMVELGIIQDGMRVIRKGIQETDHVVINGLQRARPGSTVVPEMVQMDARFQEDQKQSSTSKSDTNAPTTTKKGPSSEAFVEKPATSKLPPEDQTPKSGATKDKSEPTPASEKE